MSADGLSVKLRSVAVAVACLVALYLVVEQRTQTENLAHDAAMGVTRALAAHIDDLVTLYDYDLKAVAASIDAAGGDSIPVDTRKTIVSSVGDRTKALRLLAVLNARGDLVFESISSKVRQANFSDRDYFLAQEKGSIGLYISRPFIGRLDGELEIALSRRLTHKDGSFAGIAFGIIKLSLLKDLFDLTSTGPNGSVSLLRTDGVMLMRKPYRDGYIGRDLSGSPLFVMAKASRSGFLDGEASVDGIDRIYSFSHVGDLPLILSVGLSRADVLGPTNRRMYVLIALIMSLTMYALMLGLKRDGFSLFAKLYRR